MSMLFLFYIWVWVNKKNIRLVEQECMPNNEFIIMIDKVVW